MGNISTPFKARPTIYKGIEMRSRLEAKWAAYFEDMRLTPDDDFTEWEYEPMCFANDAGQYLPDFRQNSKNGQWTYYEVKPRLDDPVSVMKKMEIIFDSDPKAELMIWVGDPEGDNACWNCQRFHPLAWYEWDCPIEGLGDDCGIFRQVPMPQWFTDFRQDPLVSDLYDLWDWAGLSKIEGEYFARRNK